METVTEIASPTGAQPGASDRLDTLLAQYSSGAIGRRELERDSGLWFGDILAELAKRGLPLPRVDSTMHFNVAQQALYDKVFE